MASSKGEWAIAGICGLAVVGTVLTIASGAMDKATPDPVPTPTAGTLTAAQPGDRVYPECRDVVDPPCIEWDGGNAYLITETGSALPAIVVARDEVSRPRMVVIR